MVWILRDYLYVTAECVVGLFSLLGNVLVLLAIKKTHTLRTPTNCFIGSLAAADALVGLIIPPSVILSHFGLPRDFHGCTFVNSLVVLITNISILSLLGVALERFTAVKSPFFYVRVISVKRALFIVAVIWVIAILIGLIPVMGWHQSQKGFKFCAFTIVIDIRYMVYLIFFGMTVPLLLVMLVVYLYIFHIIRKHHQRASSILQSILTKEIRENMRKNKQEKKGIIGLVFVILLFAICWMPLHIINSLNVLAPGKNPPFEWVLVAIVLSHLHSVVNPFLYAFSNSKFKYAMKQVLCCGSGRSGDIDATFDTYSKKISTLMTKEAVCSTLPFITVPEAVCVQSKYMKTEQWSNERQITDKANVSTTSMNGSSPKEKICNENEPHSEKSPAKHGPKQQVTGEDGKDRSVAEIMNTSGRSRRPLSLITEETGSSTGGPYRASSYFSELGESLQIWTISERSSGEHDSSAESCVDARTITEEMSSVDIARTNYKRKSRVLSFVKKNSMSSVQNSQSMTRESGPSQNQF